jgi:hypothetical protein
MTLEAKQSLKELNRTYFDSHIDEIVWSDEKRKLVIKMKTKDKYEFVGDTAKDIYKQLVKGSMHE